jgi:periplasmic copper chaperone A
MALGEFSRWIAPMDAGVMSFSSITARRAATLIAVVAIALLPTASLATPQVTVSDGWIRALPGTLPAGGYFKLHNGSGTSISLVGASSPACGMLMLHKSDTMNGMAEMSDVERVDVAAGGTIAFAPGGYHLMCMDPKALHPGGKISVTLSFSNGMHVTSDFAVRNAAGH